MSVRASAAAWDMAVTPTAKLVALALAEGSTGDDDVYDADVGYIVELTGLTEGDIWNGLTELVDLGHLEQRDLLTFRFSFAA